MRLLALAVALALLWTAQAATMQFGSNVKLVEGIFDAENQHFTPDGRLFVSGGDNVYEVVSLGNGTYEKRPTFADATYCLGLTQIGSVVYVVRQKKGCIDAILSDTNILSAGTLVEGEPLVFRDVFTMTGVTIPNGLAADPSGRFLYVTDSAYLKGTGKIIRLALNESDPFSVVEQVTWLDHDHAGTPNGLRYFNGSLYYTDDGALRRVPILADGTAGDQVELYKESTILDDLALIPLGDGTTAVLFADYLHGGLIAVDSWTGAAVSSSPRDLFDGPSSVMRGVPPMFAGDELLVTDKGIICDKASGNFFSGVSFALGNGRRL
eukprot:Opistho-1_new@46328